MKKNLFLITFTILLAGSCKKDAGNDTTGVIADALKCKSLDKLKWKPIYEMTTNIHWIQQSCFRIEGSKYKIYTDPLSISQTDLADIILITHSHEDHFSPADIDKIAGPKTIIIAPADCNYTGKYAKRVILLPGEEYTVNHCIKIKAVPAYNITKTYFHPKSNNWVGYVITINGVTIYHAGDTERIPEMKDITCDIAMLPLGQTYTMNSVSDAAESAKDVKAKVAIPMHFDLYEGTVEDATTFKNLLEGTVKVVIKTRGQ
jgi:L-ascorbate metabolism protein UlaG (beta-lactamase superfamily)